MRQVREIIRLKFSARVPTREIARRLGIAVSTVRGTLRRFESAALNWPLPDDMTDSNPGGYSYSRFCELYRAFESKLSPTMRQTHAAGERLFVDYAGDGVPVVIDRLTGEIRKAQIFVAVLGASSFTYARATWTQGLADWIDAHTHAFAAIGGVPHLLVPDNTKAAVIKACLYDPLVNRTYAELAAHYDTAILPARPRRPRDKAKVEQAVLIVERWLLGRLRHRTFYSLAEVNTVLGELLKLLNEERPIRRLAVTRRQLLEEIDRPALKPLPVEPYEFCEWRACRVGIDYHVEALGSVSLHARRCRRAADRQDRRGLLQRRANRRAYAHRRQPQAYDRGGAYALQPSPLC
jgi:transposase